MQDFYEYLRSIGLSEVGAQEVIARLEEHRADREDLSLYKRYQEQKK